MSPTESRPYVTPVVEPLHASRAHPRDPNGTENRKICELCELLLLSNSEAEMKNDRQKKVLS
jgi:hypothetical protein